MRTCPNCHGNAPDYGNYCPFCGGPLYGSPPKSSTSQPLIGGVLCIVGGVLYIVFAAFSMFAVLDFGTAGSASSLLVCLICGPLGIFFNVIAIIGGILSVQRRMWGVAIAGAALGLVSGNVLCLIGLIYIAISRNEFQGEKTAAAEPAGPMVMSRTYTAGSGPVPAYPKVEYRADARTAAVVPVGYKTATAMKPATLVKAQVFCRKCKSRIPPGATSCPICGAMDF